MQGQDGNGEKEHLKHEIERLKDERIKRIEESLTALDDKCSNLAGDHDDRLRIVENSISKMVGVGTVGKLIIPATIAAVTAILVRMIFK